MEKKSNRKRLIITLSVIILLSVLSVGILIAFLTDSDSRNNKMTAGENVNELTGEYTPPDSQGVNDNVYQKEVTVKNTGNVSCYVRVYVDLSDSEILDKTEFSTDKTNFYSANPENVNSFANNLTAIGNNWVYISGDSNEKLNGYYYYTQVLKPGESTKPLFNWVKTTYTDASEIRQYEILSYSETVQTKDGKGEDFSDYKFAWEDFLQ